MSDQLNDNGPQSPAEAAAWVRALAGEAPSDDGPQWLEDVYQEALAKGEEADRLLNRICAEVPEYAFVADVLKRLRTMPEVTAQGPLKGAVVQNAIDAVEAAAMHERRVAFRESQLRADEEARARVRADPRPLVLTNRAQRAARPPLDWRVGGLVPVGGCLGMVWGRQGSYKTFVVAVDLPLSLVNGLSQWMGLPLRHDPEKPDVVVVLGEGLAGFPSREAAWLRAHPGATADRLWTIEKQMAALTTIAGRERMVRALRDAGVRPSLIVYDTQGKTAAAGVDENSRTDMREVYNQALALANDLECLVLLVTHPGNGDAYRPAGASSQGQDVDLALDVRHDPKLCDHGRGKSACGSVRVEKVREGDTGWGWTFSHPALAVPGVEKPVPVVVHLGPLEPGVEARAKQADAQQRSNDLIKDVVAFVRKHPDSSQTAVELGVEGRAQDIRAALKKAEEARRVTCRKGAKNAKLYRLAEAPEEHDDGFQL